MACIKRESEVNLRYTYVKDNNAPEFSLDDNFYSAQLDKQLLSNVYKNNKWGSYRLLTKNYSVKRISTGEAHLELFHGSWQWIQSPNNVNADETTINCRVHYASINFT